MSAPDHDELRLGFIPLVDCAPLAVAHERGLFAAEGLSVALQREPSWANIRDKVQAGLFDAAHMLGPMALAAGLDPPDGGLIAPIALSSGGSAITVSMALASRMQAADREAMSGRPRTARALKRVIGQRRAAGEPPLTFAAVFPWSMHAYELRAWLAEAGIDPDSDLRLVYIPPPRMCARLRSGEIDGFCVGAPWSELAAAEGDGLIVLRGADVWPAGPDKVLGVRRGWAERRPAALQALLRALIHAQLWADAAENRAELAALLAAPAYLDIPVAVIHSALEESGVVFHRHAAGFPWVSHAAWFLAQMVRWRQLAPGADLAAVARSVYRPDLYRSAALALGVNAPLADAKPEGAHATPWLVDGSLGPIAMPADRILGRAPFEPEGLPAR